MTGAGTTRRSFLVGAGTTALLLAGLPRRAVGGPCGAGPVLVCVFLRGGADALNMVVPHDDRHYHDARPTIAIGPPGRTGGAVGLEDGFGLHPALAPLLPWYEAGRLAPVLGVGRPGATRSHFEEQDAWETGCAPGGAAADGWINRHLATVPARGPVRAVCFGPRLVRSLRGAVPAQTVGSLADLDVRGGALGRRRLLGLLGRVSAGSDPVQRAGGAALEALRVLARIDPEGYRPAGGARYPGTPFGRRLREAAQLLKADVGIEVVACDGAGWDTHDAQGGADGVHAHRSGVLARGLDAFARDLGPLLGRVLVVVMSEFGRTVRENGSRGTDHGRGGLLWLLGGAVRGGRLLGRWPGLVPDDLHRGRELRVTTDYRDALSEVLRGHLGAPSTEAAFPGHVPRSVGALAPG